MLHIVFSLWKFPIFQANPIMLPMRDKDLMQGLRNL